MSVEPLKSLFDVLTVVLLGLTFFAGAGVLITGNIINKRQSEQLKAFDADIIKAKSDLAAQQERAAKAEENIALAEQHAAEANKAAGDANEKAAKAQLELARLTGPPYLVPIIHGIATPDLSKGSKQLVLLTSDTRINLPKASDGKSLTWTLILAQDEHGQHQFNFSPKISGFTDTLFSPAHSKWLVSLLTDSSGTVNVGLGGTFVAAPTP